MRTLAATGVLVLLLAGCGSEQEDSRVSDPEPTTTSSSTQSPTSPSTSETSGGGVEGSAAVADGDLPGEPADAYGPQAGDQLDVVGVAYDDVLQVRRLPDPAAEAVNAGLKPTAHGVVATGRSREVGSGIWVEVEVPEGFGWSNARYLSYLGATTDRTNDAADVEPAPNLGRLATKVAAALSKGMTDGPAKPVIVSTDGLEAVVDVTGYADDSQGGERLTITATEADGRVGVSSVQSTVICARGVDDEGRCL